MKIGKLQVGKMFSSEGWKYRGMELRHPFRIIWNMLWIVPFIILHILSSLCIGLITLNWEAVKEHFYEGQLRAF